MKSATLFKTRTQSVKSLQMSGDKALVEIEFNAVLAKALSNDLQAGDKLALQGKTEFIFKGGLVWSIVDESLNIIGNSEGLSPSS